MSSNRISRKTARMNQYFANHIAPVEIIASRFSLREIETCRMVASDIADIALKHDEQYSSEADGNGEYGISCATSIKRNYLFALMTANAVKASQEITGRNPLILELGMGSGLNCVIAALINPFARVIAYEKDPVTFAVAQTVLRKYAVEGNVLAYNKNFLINHLSDVPVDIVVNENLDGDLVREPLFQAVNAALPYAHSQTLFVPAAVDVYVELDDSVGKRRSHYFGRIDLKTEKKSPITLEAELNPGEMHPDMNAWMINELVDFDGNIVLGKGSTGRRVIEHLDLRHPLAYVSRPLDQTVKHKVKVLLHYTSQNSEFDLVEFTGEKL